MTPPRISVLLASEAPVGLVFRRGPSKLVRLIHWDRRNDRFTPGQWFRGRILLDRSDISPDGVYWIYCAVAGMKWAVRDTGGAWTAIARVPWLRAFALWAVEEMDAAAFGGGYFTGKNTVRLNGTEGRDLTAIRGIPSGEPLKLTDAAAAASQAKQSHRGWLLRRIVRTKKRDRYELEHLKDGAIFRFDQWDWAAWDRDRLVFAEAGQLCTMSLDPSKPGSVRTLYDFNAMPPPAPRDALT